MGQKGHPEANPEGKLLPLERYGVKYISLGLIAEDGSPVIWRGPMLAKMVTQFLQDVDWGELDVLLVDLPPGTGDVQLTLTQSAPLDGAVIVTTPQPVALEDVARGVQMFNTVNNNGFELSMSTGMTHYDHEESISFEELLRREDSR